MKELFTISSDVIPNGKTVFSWQVLDQYYLQPNGVNIAVVGKRGLIHLYDRHGAHVMEVLVGPVLELDWNRSGTVLAMIVNEKSQVYM